MLIVNIQWYSGYFRSGRESRTSGFHFNDIALFVSRFLYFICAYFIVRQEKKKKRKKNYTRPSLPGNALQLLDITVAGSLCIIVAPVSLFRRRKKANKRRVVKKKKNKEIRRIRDTSIAFYVFSFITIGYRHSAGAIALQ